MFDFDKEIKRKGTNCSKWDHQGGDFIPMWVADMDFPLAKASQSSCIWVWRVS